MGVQNTVCNSHNPRLVFLKRMDPGGFRSHRVGDDANGQVRPWIVGSVGLDNFQLSHTSPSPVLRIFCPSTYRLSWGFPVALTHACAWVCVLQRLDGSGLCNFGPIISILRPTLAEPRYSESDARLGSWQATRPLCGAAGFTRRNHNADCSQH